MRFSISACTCRLGVRSPPHPGSGERLQNLRVAASTASRGKSRLITLIDLFFSLPCLPRPAASSEVSLRRAVGGQRARGRLASSDWHRPSTMGSVGTERFKELSPMGTPEGNVVMSFSFDSYQLEEDELQRGSQAKGVLTFMEPASEDPEPQDRYHGIYLAMLLAGVGFLLPYNSFITDVDYLHHKYPGTSIVFDMSLTYILVALVAVILNNALVELLSLHTRISVGYLFALGPLLFVSICDVWLELFTRRQAYAINLVAVGVVAFGCTVQQSSFYGYTGLLPKRYTQGVMTGESTAGVIISLSRIFTKLLLSDEKENTVIFFFISIGMELTCFILHLLVKRTRFVRYYTSCPRKGHPERRGATDHGMGYRIHHDVTAEDIRFEDQLQGQLGSPRGSPGPEAELAGSGTYMRFDVPRPKIKRSWPSFRAMLLHRYVVSRLIWAYMLSIAMTYFITLCLFPGLESEIHNCTLGEWLPILIMAIFNLSDFVGKILAALPYDWRGTHLLVYSCLRVVFIPLFIMCVYPNGQPTFGHPAWPCVFSLLMGITNGYFGSVPMILAAGKVSPEQRELAGNTMTVSYMTGLTLGSAVAYFAYSLTSTSHSSCFYTETSNGSFLGGY
ncbi:equilibrative nucleoside transporter 4 isoform X7 [Gallus gallus]|uniref:Equilibrative nucleoside transporter 4 n=2 Tax=Gallus gallus TaxID=9031 RepID=A0A8V0ZP55_CHICK|nr:equilibrative nucleoside transporter 4 isoform X7 [Gallus gallus]